MEFIQHTINWCKGEIFEGSMVALYGAVIVIVSISNFNLLTCPQFYVNVDLGLF